LPAPLFLTSGNLLADRRYDFARDLELRGDLVAAADLMEQSIEIAPDFASAWFALGELREKLNQHGDAITAYRRAVVADPEDRHGAGVRLMRLGAEPLTAMPPAYVRSLFDQYAPDFERALLNDLDYRGPSILLRAVAEVCRERKRPMRFARALDLGCGTGLVAKAFGSSVEEWSGIDLSGGMIAKARETGLYAQLDVDDMINALARRADASAALVIAADAFVYLGDLRPVLLQSARVLTPAGFIAFTVEAHQGEGIVLGGGLRYAHAPDVVKAALEASDLMLRKLDAVSTRNDSGVAVPGLVIVAEKS
jgi:predicted TPR repeat methyltransferase